MGARSMTVRRYEEIRRRLAEGRGLREIARALGCSRDTVREVRGGLRVSPDAPKALPDPLWMLRVDWPPLIHDLGLGHPLKFLWQERPQHLTTYSNFWKAVLSQVPAVPVGERQRTRVHRRRARRSRLRRRSHRVVRPQNPRDPSRLGVRVRAGMERSGPPLDGRRWPFERFLSVPSHNRSFPDPG